jgi:hypothetical protein
LQVIISIVAIESLIISGIASHWYGSTVRLHTASISSLNVR